MIAFGSTNNGGATPAAAETVLSLKRSGVGGQSNDNNAQFLLSRYEVAASYGARTQLDLQLRHGDSDYGNAMTWKSNGNVGVGTTNPSSLLHVYTSTDGSSVPVLENASIGTSAVSALSIKANGSYGLFEMYGSNYSGNWGASGVARANGFAIRTPASSPASYMFLGPSSPNPLYLATNSLPRLTVDSSGNVGIGTTSSGAMLTVAGMIHSTSGGIKFPDGSIQTTAATGGGSSGQSMITGWPDAIKCVMSNPAYGDTYLVLGQVAGGYYYYHWPLQPADVRVRYNSDGTFSGYQAGITTSDCNKSISQLNTDGQAYYFANGGGSAGSMADGTAGAPGLYFSSDTNTGFYRPTTDTLAIATSGTEKVRVDASGNVGIGTTGPADKLHVAGDIRVGTGTTGCVKDADGTVIAGTCSSDVRFKTDIEPLGSRLEQVSQLRPVTYKWRSEEFPDKQFGHETETGLIAQEVQQAIPELVATDEEGYLKVRFTELNIYILQAVKDLYNRILGIEDHQATQDRRIANVEAAKADKAEMEAQLKAKDQKIQKLEKDNASKTKELEDVKARLDKIEKMLKSK